MELDTTANLITNLGILFCIFGWFIKQYNPRQDTEDFQALIHSVKHSYPLFFLVLLTGRLEVTLPGATLPFSLINTIAMLSLACVATLRFIEYLNPGDLETKTRWTYLVFACGYLANAMMFLEISYWP